MGSFEIDKKRKDILRERLRGVQSILNSENENGQLLFLAIIDLTFVLEQFLKIKIAEKNILLIYKNLPPTKGVRDVLEYISVNGNYTIKILESFEIFKELFPSAALTTIAEGISPLIDTRNEIYHQVVPFQKYELVELKKLLRTFYDALLKDADNLLGEIGPLETKTAGFTQEEVKKFFRDSVKKKLKTNRWRDETEMFYLSPVVREVSPPLSPMSYAWPDTSGIDLLLPNTLCPRCRNHSLRFIEPGSFDSFTSSGESFYQCSRCHLELTPEEYQIAKEIIAEENSTAS